MQSNKIVTKTLELLPQNGKFALFTLFLRFIFIFLCFYLHSSAKLPIFASHKQNSGVPLRALGQWAIYPRYSGLILYEICRISFRGYRGQNVCASS